MVTGSALLEAHDGHQSIPNNEDTRMLSSLKLIHLWQNFH